MDDDDDQEYERFGVSSWDLENEFNPKRGKKISKEKATYGIFMDDREDEDDDVKTDARGKTKRKDYTAPISFVSGGLKDDATKSTAEKPNKSQRPSMNSFNPNQWMNMGGNQQLADWERHTKGIGSKLLMKMGYEPGKGLGKNLQGITAPIEAKKRLGKAAVGAYGPERTEKDMQMERQFLGKEPIAKKDEEEGQKTKQWKTEPGNRTKLKKVKVFEKSTEEIIEEGFNWNQKIGKTKERMTIIDMTGPVQRELSSLSSLQRSRPQMPKEDAPGQFKTEFDVPEFRSNIRRELELARVALSKIEFELDSIKPTLEEISEEKSRLNDTILNQRIKYSLVLKYEQFVDEICDKMENNDLRIEDAISKFENMDQQDFRKLSRQLHYGHLIELTFDKLLQRQVSKWKPFQSGEKSSEILQIFYRIKTICVSSQTFEWLLWSHWYNVVTPQLQQFQTIKQDFDRVIQFLQNWRTILPKWMYNMFVSDQVLPKLRLEVERWDPLVDVLPVQSWIHPWLPVLLSDPETIENAVYEERSNLFEEIYKTIRGKLGNALSRWSANDTSAFSIILPWRRVFSEESFQSFIDLHIRPKLEQALASLVINPQHQIYDQWNWVFFWRDLLPLNTQASILERHFFPKWLNCLYGWLASGGADLGEVNNWYQDWRRLIGEELCQQETVRESLQKGLMMIDHMIISQTGLLSFADYYNGSRTQPELQRHPPPPPPMLVPQAAHAFSYPGQVYANSGTYAHNVDLASFRALVEQQAAQHGIVFMPLANRHESGKQIYKFGHSLIYIDDSVIFQQRLVETRRVWAPIALHDLITQCVALGL